MSTDVAAETSCRAGEPLDDARLQAMADRFNREGFLFLPGFLPEATVAALKRDLDAAIAAQPRTGHRIELVPRMFEKSAANVALFDLEPMVSFAERVIAPDCHVIHNNNFLSPPGGGVTGWHQDDAPHLIVTQGPPPTNIILPCLLFTANYYLTDVDTVEDGPTQVMPRSHLFGASPPKDLTGTRHEKDIVSCIGKAGSVVIFNNQVWHRGAPVRSQRTRYVAQTSYARRLVGHKYFPFMNYVMPEHVYKDASPRLRRLLGFLPSGAYG